MLNRYRRLIVAFALVVGVNWLLAAGYWVMNVDRHHPDGSAITFLQCLYRTIISTFTVGSGEVVPIDTPMDRIYTMLVIVLRLGTMGYGLSQMTAFVVGGDLHVGAYVIEELIVTKRPFVAIDADEAALRKLGNL